MIPISRVCMVGLLLAAGGQVCYGQDVSTDEQPPFARLIVDGIPGMVVVNWGDGLRSAYDLHGGRFYKAWSGGRQVGDSLWTPTGVGSNGTIYMDHAAWRQGWRIYQDGLLQPATARMVRYAYDSVEEKMQFSYHVVLAGQTSIVIHEETQVRAREGEVQVERVFHVEGLPAQTRMEVLINAQQLREPEALATNGQWHPRAIRQYGHEEGMDFGIQGYVSLHPQIETRVSLPLVRGEEAEIIVQHRELADVTGPTPANVDTALPQGSMFERIDASFPARLTAMTTGAQGTLYVAAAEPQGTIWTVAENEEVQRFAEGLLRPVGLAHHADRLHVLAVDALLRFGDEDDDGIADAFEVVVSGWDIACEQPVGLVTSGNQLFMGIRATCGDAKSRVVHVQDEGAMEVVLDSLGNVGGVASSDDLVWTVAQRDAASWAQVFSSENLSRRGTLFLPVQGQIVRQPVGMETGLFAGQMIFREASGRFFRVATERVGEQIQGAVFALSQDAVLSTEQAARRGDSVVLSAGASLYALRLPEAVFDIARATLQSNGITLQFTEPLAPTYGWDVTSYQVQQYALNDLTEGASVAIISASVAEDRQSVFLEVEALSANTVVQVRVEGAMAAERGVPLWSRDVWYTVHAVPAHAPGLKRTPPEAPAPNTITSDELTEGWQLLFDGRSLSGWRGYDRRRAPRSWAAVNGELIRTTHDERIDLITQLEYTNFELSFEWMMFQPGEGGVVFGVSDEDQSPEQTGIVYGLEAGETFGTVGAAGAVQNILPPEYAVTRPAGQYNHSRMRVEGNRVEHWLNGFLVLAYDTASRAWTEALQAASVTGTPDAGPGHIVLKDLGQPIVFRNIKIRPLR